jgi:hypothetical protein
MNQWNDARPAFSAMLLGAALFLLSSDAAAASLREPATGITVSVGQDGAYSISTDNPPWTLGGTVGSTIANIQTSAGSDNLGAYQQISFAYIDGAPRLASIKLYEGRPVVLFGVSYPQLAPNSNPFPSFRTYPAALRHLSYDGQFASHSFDQLGATSPWAFFDAAGNTLIISPASDFMVAQTSLGSDGTIACGINHSISFLPQGFSHQTLLAFGKGIGQTVSGWGSALMNLQGKVKIASDADVTLESLGYWTDNGAYYYYRYEPGLGYQGTLLALGDYFKRESIPVKYMQVDSWWYPKGPDAHWTQGDGIYQYVAHQAVFPGGLASFQNTLGLPLITHARWIDPSSPYHSIYKISNNVSIDPSYWDHITSYIKDAGVVTYEQDWLDEMATALETISDQRAFMEDMAAACKQKGLTMQYCMAQPRHFLESTRYQNLTTIRVSPDRFDRSRWDQFLYGSMLAGAVGIWPWCDVFVSSETDNLLLATLSGGMVGIGDRLGTISKASLSRSVRKDGVIVKPDAPLIPTDDSIQNDARQASSPMIAFTYTDHGPMRAAYVFANSRGSGAPVRFKPALMGLTGQVYVYNKFAGSGRVAAANDFFNDSVGDIAYYVAVGIGPSGIALLGDADKFVSLGRKRIADVADDGSLRVTVSFAPDEDWVTLQGYSPSAPTIVAQRGAAGPVSYDPKSGLFKVQVSPAGDATAALTLTTSSADSSPGGLTAEYYSTADLTNLQLIRIDPKVVFDWSTKAPVQGLTTGNFAVRWRGYVVPRFSDTYAFYTSSSGRVRLWVDRVQVVNDWTTHAGTEDAGYIQLVAGKRYEMILEFSGSGPGPAIRLSWSSERQGKQTIPARRLCPSAPM